MSATGSRKTPRRLIRRRITYATANPAKYANPYHLTAKRPSRNATGLKFGYWIADRRGNTACLRTHAAVVDVSGHGGGFGVSPLGLGGLHEPVRHRAASLYFQE
jgi:hypothetical protein